MPKLATWMSSLMLGVFGAIAGCGSPPVTEIEPFQLHHTWLLEKHRSDEQFKGVSLEARLTPDPLLPDKPAMLEVRVHSEHSEKPFQGRIWYRFAFRRGDRQPHDTSLILPPTTALEEGVEPRFDDWFEWAEMIEPRNDGGAIVFDAPVMFTKGKAFVQFRVTGEADLPPLELLDWFVYVLKVD